MEEELYIIEKEIGDFLGLTEEQRKKKAIQDDMKMKKNKFIYEKEYYREKVFNSWKPNMVEELDIDIELCKTKEQRDIWNYLKYVTSSTIGSDKTIKEFKILVKDKKTDKYVGIINLCPELISLSTRDKYIGWIQKNKTERIKIDNDKTQPRISFLVNIQCCVGMQPIAYNTNLGKLLVGIVFSKEVLELYREKYGYYYAGVASMSLYGKSIQYDRLKEIKYIGLTKGQGGMSHLPVSLLNKILEFTKKYMLKEEVDREKEVSTIKNKIRVFNKFIQCYYPNHDFFHKNQQRGIYIGYTGKGNELFFRGEKDTFELNLVKDLKDIVEGWKNRWAKQRWNHIQKDKKIRIAFEFKDFTYEERKKEYDRQYQYSKYHLIEHIKKEDRKIRKKTIDIYEIVDILQWKIKKINREKFIDGKEITQKKISVLLSNKYNKNISDIMIKKYWNGESKAYKEEFTEDCGMTFEEYDKIVHSERNE